MNCSKFETDIALCAGGDLPAGRIARIESHLAECEDCQALMGDLRADHGLLSELGGDPVEDAMVAQIHQRVQEEVRRAGFSRRGTLVPLLALAAALVLAVVLLRPRQAVKHVPVARVAPTHIAPAPQTNVIPAKHRVVRRHHLVPTARPGPPLLVQFVTGDPNIVIYWLVNQKPQGD
jgi:anti-sigma factor RsiW